MINYIIAVTVITLVVVIIGRGIQRLRKGESAGGCCGSGGCAGCSGCGTVKNVDDQDKRM